MRKHLENITNPFFQLIKSNLVGEKISLETPLIKAPPRIMVYLAVILILSALLFEIKYSPDHLLESCIVRLPAATIALVVLFFLNPKATEQRFILLVHLILFTVVVSSGMMTYFIPTTILLNASIIGLMILTSALFLSWQLKNQIIASLYYNFLFALSLYLTYNKTESFTYIPESFLFVFILSIVSIVACAVNLKMRLLEEQRNQEIKKSEQKYRSIIDNSLEGIFQSTLDGKWITVNKSMAQIFGYKNEKEMMRNGVKEIYVDENDRERLIEELKKQGKVENWRIRLRRKDGSVAVVRLNDRLVQNENGETILEGNIYDITEQVKAEEERIKIEEMLKKEKEKTEKLANEAIRVSGTKSKLLANLSHEIRTPMNGILGFLTLIEAGAYSNDNELKMFCSSARQSAESLLEIINSLLDLTKIEAGKIQADYIRFNLMRVIDQSISVVSLKASEKNIKIVKDIPESTETILIGDMIKLRQIFINLLNNAVKFTIDGEVIISIRTKKISESEIELTASVKDTGIGIPESKLKDLFKPYSQVGNFYDQIASGTGLGLVICKEYVELLGGKISVTSREGQGSSFSFTVRCGVPGKEESLITTQTETETFNRQFLGSIGDYSKNGFKKKREKHKILLAEDNLINQKVTIKILNTYGYKVEAVNNGAEAVNSVINDNYDLVLMDLQMPVVDGYTATEKIRALTNSKRDIPIIALTAHALIGDKEKCLSVGMTDYISKPVSGQDLVKKIDTILDITKDESSQAADSTKEVGILFDKERLKSVSLGDREFERDLLTSFLSDLDEKYKNLLELSGNREMNKIIQLAHSIKGSSYSIGANKIADEAYAIELSGKNNDWVNVSLRIEKFNKIIDETNQEIKNYLNGK